MREISRTIVSALLISKDGKLLLGKKDPANGGVYLDCRHLPGGGVGEGESLHDSIIREVAEEVGIDIREFDMRFLPIIDNGSSIKTLKETGEQVLCHMDFHKCVVHLQHDAKDIKIRLNDDLVVVQRFTQEELTTLPLIPGNKELFKQISF